MESKRVNWKQSNEFSKVGDAIYLIKQNSNDVYTFEDVAVDIITIISSLHYCTIGEIVKELNNRYELDSESKEEIISFLKELKQENIIEML